jgi:hypothetical protein
MVDSRIDEIISIVASTQSSRKAMTTAPTGKSVPTLRGQIDPYSSDMPRMSEANVYKFFETVMDEKYRTDVSDAR